MSGYTSPGEEDTHDRQKTAIELQEEKEEEEQKVKAMKQRSVFSLSWSIADNGCYMMLLQLLLITASVLNLAITVWQMDVFDSDIAVDVECSGEDSYSGPYLGYGIAISSNAAGTAEGDILYGCGWPMWNSYLRLIPSAIGAVSGVITIFLGVCLGKRVLLDMDTHNHGREVGQKIEYFDIYSNCIFRYGRKIVGHAGYVQFVSLGMDLRSYLTGLHTLERLNAEATQTDVRYRDTLIIGIFVAIFLRTSHDAMYQRLWKRGFGFKIDLNWKQGKAYQGPTVNEVTNSGTVGIVSSGNNIGTPEYAGSVV